MQRRHPRAGFSFVELQVAFIVFAISMAGLCPLVVMQSKHLKRIEGRFSHGNTYFLKPSNDAWARKLGSSASLLTSDPGGSVAAPVLVVDDGDTAFNTQGTGWQEVASADSYQDDCQTIDPGDGSKVATWQFTGLAAGWYDVRVTWLEDDEYSSTAPFEVFDGADSKGSYAVNQQAPPTGDEIDGRPWQSLGILAITSGVVNVELKNSAADKVVADSVRLIPVQNEVRISTVEKSQTSEEATVHVSVTVLVPQ